MRWGLINKLYDKVKSAASAVWQYKLKERGTDPHLNDTGDMPPVDSGEKYEDSNTTARLEPISHLESVSTEYTSIKQDLEKGNAEVAYDNSTRILNDLIYGNYDASDAEGLRDIGGKYGNLILLKGARQNEGSIKYFSQKARKALVTVEAVANARAAYEEKKARGENGIESTFMEYLVNQTGSNEKFSYDKASKQILCDNREGGSVYVGGKAYVRTENQGGIVQHLYSHSSISDNSCFVTDYGTLHSEVLTKALSGIPKNAFARINSGAKNRASAEYSWAPALTLENYKRSDISKEDAIKEYLWAKSAGNSIRAEMQDDEQTWLKQSKKMAEQIKEKNSRVSDSTLQRAVPDIPSEHTDPEPEMIGSLLVRRDKNSKGN